MKERDMSTETNPPPQTLRLFLTQKEIDLVNQHVAEQREVEMLHEGSGFTQTNWTFESSLHSLLIDGLRAYRRQQNP
jgi:hypothetical protein